MSAAEAQRLWEEDRSFYCTNSLFKCYLPVTWAKLVPNRGEGRAGEGGGGGQGSREDEAGGKEGK